MIRGRSWSSYAYAYGEELRRAEVRFDVALATGATPSTHRTCVRLVVQPPDDEPLDRYERGLSELLAEVDCLLAGVLRYAGTCEFVFQVEDLAAFAAREPVLLAQAPGRALVHRSEGWDFFVDRVCPREHDWQRITDRETAEALFASGLDPDALHGIEHAFVGDEGDLRRLEEELVLAGFDRPTVERRRLTVIRRQSLRPDALSEVTVPLATGARRLGVVYDGWRVVR